MKKSLGFMAVVLTVMLCGQSALSYAQELAAYTDYDAKNNVVTVTGVGGAVPNKAVYLTLFPGELTHPDLTDMKAADIRFCVTQEYGRFSVEIPLSEQLDGGVYTVWITTADAETTEYFAVINDAQTTEVLSQINQSKDSEELGNIISVSSEKVGIHRLEYEEYADYISRYIYQLRPKDGFGSAIEVYRTIKSAIVIKKIQSAANDSAKISTILQKNNRALEINDSLYENLSALEKINFITLIARTDFFSSPFKTLYPQMVIASKISSSSNWSQMKTLVLNYADELGIDLSPSSAYYKLSYKDDVFRAMFKKELLGFSCIREAFAQSVQEVLKADKSNSSSSSTGRGSSGGGGVYVDTELVQELAQGQTTPETSLFSDMTGHWAATDVEMLAESGVVNGFEDGTFRPDLPVTRAEFIKLIVSAFGIESAHDKTFTDVSQSEWFAPFVSVATENGLIVGYDGYFYPQNTISRQDAAVILYRFMSQNGYTLDGSTEFSDSTEILDYAKQAVGQMAHFGILSGADGRFEPWENTTRAQAARMIIQVMRYMNLSTGNGGK